MNGKDDAGMDRFFNRVKELEKDSLDHHHAFERAKLEQNIEHWPQDWGNELRIVIFGDFSTPTAEIRDDNLGIVIHPERLKDSIAPRAFCALRANVTVKERTVAELVDASRRVNIFLGAWSLVSWTNAACGWWCHVTHPTWAGMLPKLEHEDLPKVISALVSMAPQIKRNIYSSLYWIRVGRTLAAEGHVVGVYREYSGFWNAFESLVEAINILRPLPKKTREQKRNEIKQYVAQHNGVLGPGDIDALYKSVVNPGFVPQAKHALTLCFQHDAQAYIHECFTRGDIENRLYDIRNAINHGSIDGENPEERVRVESRLSLLSMMVLQMFGRIAPVSVPSNEGFTRHTKFGAKNTPTETK